ncbi:hypothetical protein T03_2908 [Trichinella britovi]|uniref:Uncharacterized protein n=1 Tax=Trichinella britovi TaxID=45882 RepID=A0A0V1CCV7_TRIBR|nr:hypothetical protein T03_2908 [Trichinella britovi]
MKQINLITKFKKFTVNCKNSLDRSSGELIHSAARLTSLRSRNEQDRDRCDHAVQEIPHVNRFKRLCFGLSCSPFLAMCVIRHHARKYQNKFPETVNEILENMRVHDLVWMILRDGDAIENTDEAQQIQSCKMGWYPLTVGSVLRITA